MNIKLLGAAGVVAFCTLAVVGPVTAHENTFQKAGKAVQYTVRKDAENTSQDAHMAVHENSIHKNRTGINAHTRYVLTPSGHKYRIVHHHHRHHKM